jgi:NADH dehydrogenase FAD-containing subunit
VGSNSNAVTTATTVNCQFFNRNQKSNQHFWTNGRGVKSNLMNLSTAQTVILGGGFTGLFTALHLSHQRHLAPIILIDQQERFIFKPLLYEFLSSEMKVDLVCPRYDELLHNSGVIFIRDTVQAIDLQTRQVRLISGLHYTYDHLVLALGSTVGYFGIEGAKENSLPFRTGEDAIALRRHLQDCLQRATQSEDPLAKRTLLTVAILGAGPSGVELAATLADLLPNWYAQLRGNVEEIRVVLLNRGEEILKGDINTHLKETAHTSLQQRTVPVELLMEAEITAVHPHQVEFKRHNQTDALSAATIVWTAGTQPHPLIKALPIPDECRDRLGRVQVTPTLQLPNFPEVFAGGDCATNVQDPLPPTAQVAYQQGAAIANNLATIASGNQPSPAKVKLRGTLLKLGLGESVANIFDRFEIKGKLGHLIREATYIQLLPTPAHNLKVTSDWLTNEIFHRYIEQKRPARVFKWIGGTVATAVLVGSSLLVWRVTQPEQFNRVWRTTSLPTLFERLLPKQKER